MNYKYLMPIFIILLAAKVFKVVTWSWWFITLPLWGPIAFIIGLYILCILLACIASLVESIFGW